MVVTVECNSCGSVHEISVDEKAYQEWKAGALIEKAMPELSADQRELLNSGLCGECCEKFAWLRE